MSELEAMAQAVRISYMQALSAVGGGGLHPPGQAASIRGLPARRCARGAPHSAAAVVQSTGQPAQHGGQSACPNAFEETYMYMNCIILNIIYIYIVYVYIIHIDGIYREGLPIWPLGSLEILEHKDIRFVS